MATGYMEQGERVTLKLPARNATGSTIEGKRFVKVNGEDFSVTKCAGTTDPIYGVTDRDIKNNDVGNVTVLGAVNVTCSEAISAGDKVGTDNAGKATVWASGNGESFAGIALSTTTTSDQDVLVALSGPGAYGIS